jgi:putative spermidine/putrescine transport system substrate-binding protein
MTRRQLLGWGATVGLMAGGMAALAGCGKGTAPAGGGSTSDSGQPATGDASKVKSQVLRTIGLSVTVQDRILEEFKAKSGVKDAKGVASTFPDAQNKILTSGAKDFDVWESIGERVRGMLDAKAISPVPVSAVKNWQYAHEIFRNTDPRFEPKAQISGQIYTDDKQGLWMVPTVYNFDSVGYRPDKVEEPTSWTAIFDEKYKGKTGLNTDPLIAFPQVMIAMKTLGLLDIKNYGNPGKKEIDEGIKWAIAKKRGGQFRSLWGDFGELVNLMASGEIVIADAWQPAVMAVMAQGVPCKYATPKEGYRAWAIGPMMIKGTPNADAAAAYIDYWLSGPPAITVSEQGYYSPVTTIKDAMPKAKYDFWYEGKPWVGPTDRGIKEGDVRDGGSLAERSKHIAVWHQWPDQYDYLIQKWDEFLSA